MTDVISITRRGLIGGSAVAGAVAATSSAKRALAQGGPTERLAYVGCYTPPGEGIVLYRVNADTGAMTQVKVFSGISNPSWIALDPLHRVLYAVNEDAPSGGVSAFTVDHASGDLKLINKVDSHGKWPCHLSVHPSGKFVLVANYGTGNVSVFPILANGGLGDLTDTESDTGALNPPKAADNPPGNFAPSDHTGPKMHMIQSDPSGQFVIANDAGLDKTLIWTLDLQTGKLTPGGHAVRAVDAGLRAAPFCVPAGRTHLLQFARAGRYRYRLGLRSEDRRDEGEAVHFRATQRLRGQQPVLGTCGLSGRPVRLCGCARARRHRLARGGRRRRIDLGERSLEPRRLSAKFRD
jgi:hypothetical protein